MDLRRHCIDRTWVGMLTRAYQNTSTPGVCTVYRRIELQSTVRDYTLHLRKAVPTSSILPAAFHPGTLLQDVEREAYNLGPQLFQQHLSVLQASSVKPLGEPAIDRHQEITRGVPLTLLLPQTREAHGGAQLQGFRLLATSDV